MITNERTGRHRADPMANAAHGRPLYGAPRTDTVVIALAAAAPMAPPTVRLPPVRLLPPLAADRRTRLRLTRRGRQVRAAAVAALVLTGLVAVAVLTRGQYLTWAGWAPIPH